MEEREINRYWKHILNTMNDGLMLVAPDGTVLMVNRAFERLTGWAGSEVVGSPCTVLNCDVCEKLLDRGAMAWCTLFAMGQDVRKRCVIEKKDGSYLPALKNASLLRDEQGAVLGAVETLTDLTELERLDHEIDHLALQLDSEGGFHGIIGNSPVMLKVFELVEKAAKSDAPVIIYGESGTGKELVARAIHLLGRRREGPFIQLNCAALNEALLESELFGHVKGAFTGATRHRMGRFEASHGGDIYLDEIGDVPLSVQVKLLRVLETRRFERVGDHRSIHSDVRIITATNKDLARLVAGKEFREDFYFRINVIPIHLPPLRERLDDLPLLVNTFILRLRKRTGRNITGLTSEAMDRFVRYSWPGNVRELKSALEYGFVIAEGEFIGLEHLPAQIVNQTPQAAAERPAGQAAEPSEKAALIAALRKTSGNQSAAARILGVSRVTVWNRMRKHGINLQKVLES